MAIYHFSAKVISRSSGSSATAAAAYRAGEKIIDKRTGEIHDYTRKKGVDSSWILAPQSAPDWVLDREKLWNEVESIERRKDSQLAREINIALPTELEKSQQLQLVREFVNEQFVSKGMVADVSFHDLNSHNPHAHIMLTMREIDKNGFSTKKNRGWNKRELLEKQRLAWATHTNKALEIAGVNQTIDHRSLEAQGAEHIPQIHLGTAVNAMRKRGIVTERAEKYLEIEAANREIRKSRFHLGLLDRLESTSINQEQFTEIEAPINTPKPNPQPQSQSDKVLDLSRGKQRSQILKIASELMRPSNLDIGNTESESSNYNLTIQNKLFLMEAKDGRGEIFRFQNGRITSQGFTEKDFQILQGVYARKYQNYIAHTAERFLHLMGRKIWNSSHGSVNYNLMTNKKGLLLIEAKDGRGEILRREDGQITARGITLKDVENFKTISTGLERKLKQVKSKEREQGFER